MNRRSVVALERSRASTRFRAAFSGSSTSSPGSLSLRGTGEGALPLLEGNRVEVGEVLHEAAVDEPGAELLPEPLHVHGAARRRSAGAGRRAGPGRRRRCSARPSPPPPAPPSPRRPGRSTGRRTGRSAPVRRSLSGFTTSGITSPARRMSTQSPTRMSLRRISSSLWSVARDTSAPESRTGFTSTTGVSTPVRPTEAQMLPDLRLLLLRRVLEGDRPARELRGRAEPPAPVEVVHLHDDAVGVVGEREAPLRHLVAERLHLRDPVERRFSGFVSKPRAARASSFSQCVRQASSWPGTSAS